MKIIKISKCDIKGCPHYSSSDGLGGNYFYCGLCEKGLTDFIYRNTENKLFPDFCPLEDEKQVISKGEN